jgi:hypothetical protein
VGTSFGGLQRRDDIVRRAQGLGHVFTHCHRLSSSISMELLLCPYRSTGWSGCCLRPSSLPRWVKLPE